MIFIAHRGNIQGPEPKVENNPKYLWEALNNGFRVEADVWYDNGWWLGHDKPQYKVKYNHDLLHFWCHAKNEEAFCRLRKRDIFHCFWHQTDDYTLTSKGYIWVYPGKKLLPGSICVLPEQDYKGTIRKCGGICSDYIGSYRRKYK